jgi:hypothetical protein
LQRDIEKKASARTRGLLLRDEDTHANHIAMWIKGTSQGRCPVCAPYRILLSVLVMGALASLSVYGVPRCHAAALWRVVCSDLGLRFSSPPYQCSFGVNASPKHA